MKTIRILAIVPLALISLMNVGYPFGTDPKPDTALAIVVAALGAAGVVAVYGLARRITWGIPVALAVSSLNVVGALIALANDGQGAAIGLVVSAVALVLVLLAGSASRRTSVA